MWKELEYAITSISLHEIDSKIQTNGREVAYDNPQ